jgi:hypothetical protein
MIESQAPILQALLKWCEKVCAWRERQAEIAGEPLGAEGRTLEFHTTSSDYFLNLREIMAAHNFSIIDSDQTFSSARSSRSDLKRVPRIIYCKTTDETMNALQTMLDAGTTDPDVTCVIVDRHEANQGDLLEIENEIKEDDLFAQQLQVEEEEEEEEEEVVKEENARDENVPFSASKKQHSEAPSPTPSPPPGLEIISAPIIYDDLFRQVRQWTRNGFIASQIQAELDTRFKEVHDVMVEQHWSRHTAAEKDRDDVK